MPTASTSAGTQKWLSVSTARRFVVFKKRSLAPMWGAIAPRLYTGARRFQSGKNRPSARLKAQADRPDVARASCPHRVGPLVSFVLLFPRAPLAAGVGRSPAGRGETRALQTNSRAATFWR